MTALVAERAPVALVQRQIACPAHLAPFRAEYPLGWDIWATLVSQAALDSPMLQTGLPDPRYWKYEALFWEVNQDEGWRNVTVLPSTRASITRIRQMLFDRPACEWVPPPTLLGAYNAAGIGRPGVCSVCRLVAPGTPFPVKSGQSYAVIAMVCLKCATLKRVMCG